MDKSLKEITELMKNEIIKGRTCWVKWTCPGCNERCTSPEANAIPLPKKGICYHDKKEDGSICGTTFIGDEFGLRVAGGSDLLVEVIQQYGIGVKQFFNDRNH